MPFVPLDTSRESGLKPAVFLTPEEQQWGEDKATHDVELQKEIDRAKSPAIKKVLLEEQQKRAAQASQAPEEAPAKKGFTPIAEVAEKEGPGLFERLIEQSLPASLGRFQAAQDIENQQLRKITAKGPDGKSEFDIERERRIAADEKADPASMMKWAHEQAKERVFGKPQEDVPIIDQLTALKDAAVADPIKFGKGLLESAAAHPEYFLAGPLGPALAVGESALEQLPEKGRVDWGQASLEGVLTAAPAAVVHGVIRVGHARAAAEKGAKVTPEAETQAVAEVKAKVEEGVPPTQAADQVLEAMGVKPQERASLVNDAKEVIDAEEGKLAEGDKQQHKDGDAQREEAKPSGGDSNEQGRQVPQEEEKVAPPEEAKVVRPQQFQPLEGVSKEPVPVENARAILESAGMDAEDIAKAVGTKDTVSIGALRQSLTKFMGGQKFADPVLREAVKGGKLQAGSIDPKLLAAMAAMGLGAGGAYALTQDKWKAIQAAMALGATFAAFGIARRMGRSVDTLVDDSRFAKGIKEPFIAFDAMPKTVGIALDQTGRAFDALLTEPIRKRDYFNPLELKRRADRKEASQIKVRDWLQGYRDMELNPREQAYANAIKDRLDSWGSVFQDAGALDNLREHYLTGMYRKPPFQSMKDILRELSTDDAFRGNYTGMSRKSRFNLSKVIPDYRTAEKLHAEGKFPLVPLTNDPVKIMVNYGRSMQKTIAVNKLVNDLKSVPTNAVYEKTGVPVPVIISMNADEALGRVVKSNQKMQDRLGFSDTTRTAMDKLAVLDAKTDYVPVNHPSLSGLLVHKDVAPAMKMLFDTSDSGPIYRGAYAASMASKSLFFTYSFFHPTSLGVVFGTTALPGRLGRIFLTPKYYSALPVARQILKNGAYAPMVKKWAEGGLEFYHTPQDMDPNIVSRILDYGAKGPIKLPLKAMRVANDWIVHALWGEIWPTLKLASAHAELQGWLKKNPKATPEAQDLAVHQISKGINTLFGGQNWFHLANDVPDVYARRLAQALLSPRSRRNQQMMFLSPDWNISAIRAWTEGFKSVLPGISRQATDGMYQSYILWTALTYIGVANYLSNKYTGHDIWDQVDWTYVDRGDGTKIQLNKHGMEMSHLLMNPTGFFFNKLNLIPREVIAQAFGKEWVAWDDKTNQIVGPPMKQYPYGLTRPVHALKTFLPLSIANLIRDPEAGLGGIVGTPIYGTPYKEREAQAVEKARAEGKDVEAARTKAKKRTEKAKEKSFRPAAP